MRHSTTTDPDVQPTGRGPSRKGPGVVASLSALIAVALLLAFGGPTGGHINSAAHAASISNDGRGMAPNYARDPGPANGTPTMETGGETKSKGPTPTVPANTTPISEAGLVGWERGALTDLAEVLNWPTGVTYDNSGRLKVQAYNSSTAWSQAHVRAFDFDAG